MFFSMFGFRLQLILGKFMFFIFNNQKVKQKKSYM